MLDKLSFGPVLLTLAEKAAALKVDTSRWRQLDSLQDQGTPDCFYFLQVLMLFKPWSGHGSWAEEGPALQWCNIVELCIVLSPFGRHWIWRVLLNTIELCPDLVVSCMGA